jgi:hypothetical protein
MDLGRAGGNILRSRGCCQRGVCDVQKNDNLFSFTEPIASKQRTQRRAGCARNIWTLTIWYARQWQDEGQFIP